MSDTEKVVMLDKWRGKLCNMNTAFIIQSAEGDAKGSIRNVRLRLADKTLMNMPGAGVIVSSIGYGRLGIESGGVTLPVPTVVAGNAGEKPNGFTDDMGNVWWRSVFVARSRFNETYKSDRTIIFNAERDIRQDYLAKAKKAPNICKVTAKGQEPSKEGANDKRIWVKRMVVNEMMDLWVDVTNIEVVTWLQQEDRTADFAPRKAQTKAVRNAIKNHPVIFVPNLGELRSEQIVPCTCWFTKDGPLRIGLNLKQCNEMVEQIMASAHDGDVTVTREEDLPPDESESAIDVECEETVEPPPATVAPDTSDIPENIGLVHELLELQDSVKKHGGGTAKVNMARKACGLDPLSDLKQAAEPKLITLKSLLIDTLAGYQDKA